MRVYSIGTGTRRFASAHSADELPRGPPWATSSTTPVAAIIAAAGRVAKPSATITAITPSVAAIGTVAEEAALPIWICNGGIPSIHDNFHFHSHCLIAGVASYM